MRLFQQQDPGTPSEGYDSICNLQQLPDLLRKSADRPEKFRPVFPYQGLKPSQIVSVGIDFPSILDKDLYDSRVCEPVKIPQDISIVQQALVVDPVFSVVIPCFEPGPRWLKSFEFWRAQQHRYELVLVDDGSPTDWLKDWIASDPEHLTLIRLPKKKDLRGSHNFRAGIARNAGVYFSRGTNLVFCDSDILVPPQFLARVEDALKRHDVVMPRRWQLSPQARVHANQDIVFSENVILGPGAYWEDFQVRPQSWNDNPSPWKWTSTFCLAMRRQFFQEIGTFKETFVTYGFEDTEWGYRAFLKKANFYLLPVDVFHLHQTSSQSAYKACLQTKQQLFRISAERFFRHHPHQQVFENLKSWLD